MICPSCGVDSDLYLEQKTEKERGAKGEKELKQMFGEQLRSIQRKRALIGGALGALGGLLSVFLCFIFRVWLLGDLNQFWAELSSDFLAAAGSRVGLFDFGFLLLSSVALGFLGFLAGRYGYGKGK